MTPLSLLRSAFGRLPMPDRVRQSARMFVHVWRGWRSPARQFLVIPPGHYYSPLPDPAEVTRDADRVFAMPAAVTGVDVDRPGQLALLRELAAYQPDLPFRPAHTPELRYWFDNGYFSAPDGVLLYSMLRHLRPARVVEIGSGHTSALMLDTDERFLGGRTEFTFLDPNPERVRGLIGPNRAGVRVLAMPVQQLPLAEFDALQTGDVLFIDSSHVSKIGSDCNHLYFEVLPRLTAGVVVHIHDIFWPFEYPRHWVDGGRAWNEAYLVRALLSDSRRYRVLCFGSYLESQAAAEWAAALPGATRRSPADPLTGASSLWLRVNG